MIELRSTSFQIRFIVFLLMALCGNLAAQSKVIISEYVQLSDSNIIKLSFSPANYKTNENVSDAVILDFTKPKNSIGNKINILKNNTPITLTYAFDEVTNYRGFMIQLEKDEKIFGGGERALPLNRRGYVFNLENNPWYGYGQGADNLNFSVPFFTSSRGFALFFDNPSKGRADIGKKDPDNMSVTFSGGELNVYLIFGKDNAEILQRYHNLTGRQELPPRWALGSFMSRFGYSGEQQVKSIIDTMRDENMPFDAVIFDLFWFGDSIKGTMGNLDWVNKNKWPDPAGLIRELKQNHLKTILITEPFILKSSTNYLASLPYHAVDSTGQAFVLKDFYFGSGGLLDIFRKDARKWFWEKYELQNKIGVDGWWSDLGEPEKHPVGMYHDLSDMYHKRLFRADEVHNIYGHFWTKMLFENYGQYYPDTRLFNLNRSGFAGSQRYGIFPWSGDVSRSWSGFKAQLPLMLGMSMSGIPYIHSDAGGFAGGEGDHELYLRWLQFSVFTPIFRPHGTALFDLDPQAFSYPSEPAFLPEPYKSAARDVLQLRYKMLPYNYTLSYRHTTTGAPLVSPLYFSFPDDSVASEIEDQFMWGDQIMVAPVTDKSATQRKCYFPQGNWYDLNWNTNNSTSAYHAFHTLDVHINSIFAFAKAGSFIPLVDKRGKTSEDYLTDTITVHYYYDLKASSFTLFDDNGLSRHSIQKNEYELLTFNAEPDKKELKITVSTNHGNFQGKPQQRTIKLKVHGAPPYKSYQIDNQIKKRMTGKAATSWVEFLFSDQPVVVKFSN